MTPTSAAKRREKVPGEENPTAWQISTTGSSVVSSSCFARWNRRAATYGTGDDRTTEEKIRLKWNSLYPTWSAMSATLSRSVRCSRMNDDAAAATRMSRAVSGMVPPR